MLPKVPRLLKRALRSTLVQSILASLFVYFMISYLIPSLSKLGYVFSFSVPLTSLFGFIGIFLLVFYLIKLFRKGSILEYHDARMIVLWCSKPQSTEKLNSFYQERHELNDSTKLLSLKSQLSFHDCINRLENAGYIKYSEGKWESTEEALEIIKKDYGNHVS